MKLLSCNVRSFALASLVLRAAAADCDCGYTTDVGTGDNVRNALFTDAFETDFRHVADLKASEWRPQTYNKTAEITPTNHGRLYSNASTLANTVGPDAGLQLVVGSQVVDNLVRSGEVAAKRKDFFHGSYRASIKLSSEPGTCAAFYWYFNDTQEIDMEFLSKEFHTENSSYPVNIVLHSPLSAAHGFDAVKAGTWTQAFLPFNPTDGFHEYRFDFVPDVVYFYADGEYLTQMTGAAVPTVGGQLLMNHWSNGKATWTGGPPKKDAVMTVAYVKTYFNSSSPERQAEWQKRCPDIAKGSVCALPSLAEKNSGETFFNLTSLNGGDSASGSDSGGSSASATDGGKSAGFMVSPSSVAVLLSTGMVSYFLSSL
ncbi:concanavalin A-like lectin/glucanase domain-containing protein [Cercophora newfieldiana]|uniref:Concanavalin A-like lectin/glucanase domain-containing protein n=1 Tax=Cercophora newfieldiana TaxID=92897 RepID=A0AA39Y8X1_9PEZI|nr:concanavalin A-like lectin/glucanase domain-containing protein [Cercophora newfieldiana]